MPIQPQMLSRFPIMFPAMTADEARTRANKNLLLRRRAVRTDLSGVAATAVARCGAFRRLSAPSRRFAPDCPAESPPMRRRAGIAVRRVHGGGHSAAGPQRATSVAAFHGPT